MAQEIDPKLADANQRLVLAVMKIIYDPAISRQLLKMMQGAEPAEGLARAAQLVLGQMREKAQNAPPGLIEAAGPVIIAFLMELAEAAQLFKRDPALLKQAVGMMGRQQPAGQPAAQPVAPPAAPQGAPQGLIAQGA